MSAGQLVIARAWTRRGGIHADLAVSHLLTGIASLNGYVRADPAAYATRRLVCSPAKVKGCQVTIGVTMALMLIIMV